MLERNVGVARAVHDQGRAADVGQGQTGDPGELGGVVVGTGPTGPVGVQCADERAQPCPLLRGAQDMENALTKMLDSRASDAGGYLAGHAGPGRHVEGEHPA